MRPESRRKPAAQTSLFEGKVVVVASGFGSGLPDSLGFGRVGDFVMGAQAEVETSVDMVEVYLGRRFSPGFFAWLVPTHEGRALAGLLARRDTKAHMEAFLRHLKDQGKIPSRRAPFKFGGIPLKPLRRTSGNRVIVVGDAAGQVKPTTGGGIYYGLLCADIAVDVLDRAIAGNDSLRARPLRIREAVEEAAGERAAHRSHGPPGLREVQRPADRTPVRDGAGQPGHGVAAECAGFLLRLAQPPDPESRVALRAEGGHLAGLAADHTKEVGVA